MNANENQIWFPAKKYGWGWGAPCTWQGWAVFAVFVVLVSLAGAFLLPNGRLGFFIASAVTLALAVFIICFIKGEKPRWRWGDAASPHSRSIADRLADLEDLRRRQLISETEFGTKRQELLKQL